METYLMASEYFKHFLFLISCLSPPEVLYTHLVWYKQILDYHQSIKDYLRRHSFVFVILINSKIKKSAKSRIFKNCDLVAEEYNFSSASCFKYRKYYTYLLTTIYYFLFFEQFSSSCPNGLFIKIYICQQDYNRLK